MDMTIGDILDLLERHERTSRVVLNMAPPESTMSIVARLPLVLDTYHRYFFEPDDYGFRGALDVGPVHAMTLRLLSELLGASHVSVRPLSGLNTMGVVMAAARRDGRSAILTIAMEQGGHPNTLVVARRMGMEAASVGGDQALDIDLDRVEAEVRRRRPTLLYVDQCNVLFPFDYAGIVRAARAGSPACRVHVDCSHIMGLVIGGAWVNPLTCGADSIGGSTHKTLPGPHKGVLASNDPDWFGALRQAEVDLISSQHFGAILSLGIVLKEMRDLGGREYAGQTVANARRLAGALQAGGFEVFAADRGFTASHQIWMRSDGLGVDAPAAAQRLFAAGIRINNLGWMPGFNGPALRVGVNEATYHGLREAEMERLGELFTRVARGRGDGAREAVEALRAGCRPWFGYGQDPAALVRAGTILRELVEASGAGAAAPRGVGG